MKVESLGTIYLEHKGDTLARNGLLVVGATLLLSLLAQITLPLPFTPVPITGQTFGVALISLLLGRRLAPLTVLLYLAAGALGMPVFSAGKAGLTWGPTLGYLAGMLLASAWVGWLADRGWARTFWWAWAAAASGSVIIFSCGLLVLSYFVPAHQLAAAGLWPFLPGDLIKNILAAGGATACARYFSR